jgi:hypothetical protein
MKKPYTYDHNRKALFKMVNKDKHFFNKGKSWGIDVETLANAVSEGITCVIYCDPTHQKEYTADVNDVFAYSWIKDFGYGQQYFLNEKYWQEEDLNAEVYQVS